MKKVILLLLCAIVAANADAATKSDSIRARLLDGNGKDGLVALHRGDWRNYVENSLEAIQGAIDMDADIVEIDLWRTADGELILMHDKRVDRTTTGKGLIADMTMEQINELRLRTTVGGRTPYRIPTLRQALQLGKGKILFNLDKAFDYFDQVVEILDETGTTDQVIMKSAAPADEVLERYGKYLDKIIYMPLVNCNDDEAVHRIKDYVEKLHPVAFELCYADSTARYIPECAAAARQGGARVWINTLWGSLCGGRDDFASIKDPDAGYGYLIDNFDCTIIQTDQPKRTIEYMKRRGMKK